MAEGVIESLSIEIGASSDKARSEINKCIDTLKKLKAAQDAVNNTKTAGSTDMFKNVNMESLNAMSKVELLRKKMALLKQELSKKMSVGKIDDKGITNAAIQIKNVQQQIQKIEAQEAKASQKALDAQKKAMTAAAGKAKPTFGDPSLMQNLRNISKSFSSSLLPAVKSFNGLMKTAAGYAAKLAKSMMSFTGKALKFAMPSAPFKALTDGFKKVQTVLSAIGRIAFYRAIRSAIKYVTDALKEGTENAYWYSREFGDATKYISEAFDRMSSANFKMSNQLGAAWSTLVAALEPIILKIIEMVTRAADAVTQLFAVLSGKGIYMKSIDYNKQWGESASGAAKAAKEWKNQLMGFDEINRLEEPSDRNGGGGGGTPDYGKMFEETDVSKFFKQIKEMVDNGQWKQLGELLGKKVNDIVSSIGWESLGKKFGEKIRGIVTLGYSFLKTVNFVNIGSSISKFINGTFGNIDFTELGALRMRLKTALWDVFYGAIIDLDWSLMAKSMGDYLTGTFDELSGWIRGLDTENIATALKDFVTGIDYAGLAESFFSLLGTAFGAAMSLLKNLLGDAINGVRDYFKQKTEEMGGDAWEGFKKGIVDAWAGIKEWVKLHIYEPFVGAVKDLLGIHSPSTVFMDIGKSIIQGLWDGISSKWNDFLAFFQGLWDGLKSWWDGLSLGAFHIPSPHFEWTYTEATGAIAKALEFVGLPATIPHLNIEWYAQGGFPEDGLFMANHGELVGQFSNGKTAVANNEQITEGIASAVYDAFMTAFSQTGGNGDDRPVNIYLDGRQIAQSTTKYQRQFARAGA